jgi:transcriptional regulator with XRE-family HTH domain
MPIKQIEVLSRGDFDDAVVRLRLSVSEIAKETGIPRTYLSEFRNGDRKLRPEHQAKLRDYFESKGIEFDDVAPSDNNDDAPPNSPHPRLKTTTAPRCFFPIADSVSDDVVARTLDVMEENDAELVALFKQNAERNSGLFGDGDFTDDTRAVLQNAFGLLAENYVLFRLLRGWRVFGVTPGAEQPQTVRDVVFGAFAEHLQNAGLVEAPAPATPETEEA